MFWPFTVWGFLKPIFKPHEYWLSRTRCCNSTYRLRYWNNTSLSLKPFKLKLKLQQYLPFTVLKLSIRANEFYKLQQYLPFTVLKRYLPVHQHWRRRCNSTYRLRYWNQYAGVVSVDALPSELQQYLPFTVLKLSKWKRFSIQGLTGCNSTYRLRYWNTIISTICTVVF